MSPQCDRSYTPPKLCSSRVVEASYTARAGSRWWHRNRILSVRQHEDPIIHSNTAAGRRAGRITADSLIARRRQRNSDSWRRIYIFFPTSRDWRSDTLIPEEGPAH